MFRNLECPYFKKCTSKYKTSPSSECFKIPQLLIPYEVGDIVVGRNPNLRIVIDGFLPQDDQCCLMIGTFLRKDYTISDEVVRMHPYKINRIALDHNDLYFYL